MIKEVILVNAFIFKKKKYQYRGVLVLFLNNHIFFLFFILSNLKEGSNCFIFYLFLSYLH